MGFLLGPLCWPLFDRSEAFPGQFFVQKAMSFCDVNGFLRSNTRDKWEAGRPTSVFVPDDEFEELCWEDGQRMLVMPRHSNRPPQKQLSSWAASVPPLDKPVSRDQEDASVYVGDIATSYDGTLDAVVDDGSSRVAGFLPAISDDDEMIAWLQYPSQGDLRLDDPDPALYSGHHAVSYLPSLSLEKSDGGQCRHSVHQSIGAMLRERPSIGFAKGKPHTSVTITDSAQAIVCRGSQTQSFVTSFGNPDSALTTESGIRGPAPGTQLLDEMVFSSKAASLPWPLVGNPYCFHQSDSQKIVQSISRAAPDIKPTTGVPYQQASLECIEHIDGRNVDLCMSTDSSIESTITRRSLQGPNVLMAPNVSHCVTAATSTLHQMQGMVSMKTSDEAACIDDMTVCSGSVVADIPSGSKSSCSVDANKILEKRLDAFETTGTSCADGYGNTTASKGSRIDDNGGSVKRQAKDLDDSDSQSEDLVKQPPLSQSILTKRSRAAEVHNKSERKRRERINEKLKALQELIPNANKTDKASVLDEAIEYLKALQSQILMMSYTTGITIPPVVTSHSMLHPHVPPHTGIGVGAGMGVKTGDMDIGGAMSTCLMPTALAPGSLIPLVTIPALSTPANNVVRLPQNALSRPMVGCSTNFFPLATSGPQPYLAPTNQMQKPAAATSHKTPSLCQHTRQPSQL